MGNRIGLCSDCESLLTGTPPPHQYLVATDGSRLAYLCLICDTHLTCERSGDATTWTVVPVPDYGAHAPPGSRGAASRP